MNRLVLILGGGVIVVGAIALLLYSSGRTVHPVPSASPIASPAAAKPAPSPSAERPKPAASPAVRPAEPPPASTPKPEAAPTTGTLILEADQPDTTVFIDRKFLGPAPQTVRDVTPGEHQLIFSPSSGESIRMTVDVEPGTKTITARFKEVRLDERAEVVHKHAFGSCTGTLLATPEGLTYRTRNTEDAFTVPLTSPETFALDVIEKNLKVKLKGGKTYNFTDPGGTLDKLYAFHQAVEKARQRLPAGRRP